MGAKVLPLDRTDAATLQRWVGVGRSSSADAFQAGADAARAATTGSQTRLVIVFCSDHYDLPELVRGIRGVTGEAPLIGCTTAGEIAAAGASDASVVVTALGGPGFSVATGGAVVRDGCIRDAGAEAVECLSRIDQREHQVLLLLSDGLMGDQQETVRGAYSVAGAAVPLVGGCAGDGLKMTATWQLHGDEVLQHAVVAAAIGSDAPIGVGVRHGWRKVGEPMLVTSSGANRVKSLEGQPALDVYLARLGAPPEVHADPAAFTRFAMTHPLGLSRRSGEEVRFVTGADFDDRSLLFVAEVPQGGLAWFMEGDDASVLTATEDACTEALAALGGRPPAGLLAFDCIARKGVLGEGGVREEVNHIARFADGAPVAGFYTYGEIARTRGVSGFHNQTLVVLALG